MYYIKKITMTGRGVESSTVQLKKGVNILYGPSNTGKSYIGECINYMMGSKETRIARNKGYENIHIEFDVDGQCLSMDRKIGNTKTHVESNVDGIESGDYTLDGKNRICHVWLKLMGIKAGHRILNSAHCQKEELNNRAFDHIFVIREKNVDSEKSILLPSEHSRETSSKMGLLFLMTGDDHDDGMNYDKPEVDSAKRAAVREFAREQLDVIAEQQESLEQDTPQELPVIIEQKISSLLAEIEHKESEISKIILQNRDIGEQIYILDQEIAEASVLQNRYKSLQSQYSADLKRLTFMVEGEVRKKEMDIHKLRKCPFCGNEVHGSKEESCVSAAQKEVNRLSPRIADLKSLRKRLNLELEKKQSLRDELELQMKELEERIQTELQPKVEELRVQLAEYSLALMTTSQKSAYENAREKIQANLTRFESRPKPPEVKINSFFSGDIKVELLKIVDRLLRDCHFDRYRDLVFDDSKFDVIINDTEKRSYGKGYRAFINVLVSIAVQEYLRVYGSYKPEIFVIDSPVLSLKEDVDDTELATEGMKASLFNYILQHPCANQIIIIENELPEADYSSAYLREFTKENGFWKTSPVTYRKK